MSEGQPDRLWAAIRRLGVGEATDEDHRLLFEEFQPMVRRFLVRLGISPEDSADLTQDVFFRVSTGRGSFKDEAQFRAWILTIARNALRNRQRNDRTQKRDGQEESLSGHDEDTLRAVPHHQQQGPNSALDALLARESMEELMEAISQLPPRMRQCMLLRVVQEYPYREIAKLLRISIETVKAQLHMGRNKLRLALTQPPRSER